MYGSCIIIYMMALMFGQSLMDTGVAVIMLHAKTFSIIMYCMKPLVTVSMEAKPCMKNVTCDWRTCHGTESVCKVS